MSRRFVSMCGSRPDKIDMCRGYITAHCRAQGILRMGSAKSRKQTAIRQRHDQLAIPNTDHRLGRFGPANARFTQWLFRPIQIAVPDHTHMKFSRRRREVKQADWNTPAAFKQMYGNASIVGGNRAVFNIKGNDYRLVVKINCPHRVVYIRCVGTHAEYNKMTVQEV